MICSILHLYAKNPGVGTEICLINSWVSTTLSVFMNPGNGTDIFSKRSHVGAFIFLGTTAEAI